MSRTGANILTGATRIGRPLFHFMRNAVRAAVDFVFPPQCLLCGHGFEEGRWLCSECLSRVLDSRRVVLHERPEDFQFLSGVRHFEGIFTAWEFNQDLEQLIHCMKYSGMKNLAGFLGAAAGEAIGRDPDFRSHPYEWMLPVPLHKVRQRERGYNQSAWVCDGLSKSLGIPVLTDGLFRKRNTRTQTGKSGEERQKNVEDAFGIKHPERIQGVFILLADDVATTGSTLNSCAEVLKQAGARTVYGAALARPLLGASGGRMI